MKPGDILGDYLRELKENHYSNITKEKIDEFIENYSQEMISAAEKGWDHISVSYMDAKKWAPIFYKDSSLVSEYIVNKYKITINVKQGFLDVADGVELSWSIKNPTPSDCSFTACR